MQRGGYELKALLFGRPIRPSHFAVMLATGVISWQLLTSDHVNVGSFCACASASHILGAVSGIASTCLFLGWFIKPAWKRKTLNAVWFSEWGLLLASGVWLTRAVYVALSDSGGLLRNPYASMLLSLAWAIGASGAYLLERYDEEMRSKAGE